MSEGSSEGSLFIDILTNLIVKTFYQQITIHLMDIESFLSFSNDYKNDNKNIDNSIDNVINDDDDNSSHDDTCNSYISHSLSQKSLHPNRHTYDCTYNNHVHGNNYNKNDKYNSNTEKILKKIIKFIIISDHILQSHISPPSTYNQSLSLNSSEKTRIFLGEILVSHLNNPLSLFSNFTKFQGISNNPPSTPQNNNFMYPTGVLPQKEGVLLPLPIQTKLIKFAGMGGLHMCMYAYVCIYMYVCKYIYTFALYIYIRMYMFAYVYEYVYIYIYMYVL
jgi:hypothetical protein